MLFGARAEGAEQQTQPVQDAWVPRGLRPWLPFVPPPSPQPHIISPNVTILDIARLAGQR